MRFPTEIRQSAPGLIQRSASGARLCLLPRRTRQKLPFRNRPTSGHSRRGESQRRLMGRLRTGRFWDGDPRKRTFADGAPEQLELGRLPTGTFHEQRLQRRCSRPALTRSTQWGVSLYQYDLNAGKLPGGGSIFDKVTFVDQWSRKEALADASIIASAPKFKWKQRYAGDVCLVFGDILWLRAVSHRRKAAAITSSVCEEVSIDRKVNHS